jgi:uracil-DNA glycosylase
MNNTKLKEFVKFTSKQPLGFAYKTDGKPANKSSQGPDKACLLEKIKKAFASCSQCPLATQGRKQVVFGEGSPSAELMFVGEGPGRDEDKNGRPFVGRAGKLLDKIILAMGLTREQVYISNAVKCRPPNNRTPLPDESNACMNLILKKELEIINPKIICALGSTAAKAMLGEQTKISSARGEFFNKENRLVMPTYHPAYLLRNPSAKAEVWKDMLKICEKLGIKAPGPSNEKA